MGVSPRWAAPPEISAWGLWHRPNPYMLVAAAWGLHSSAPAFAPLQLYEMQRAAVRLGDTELCWVDAGSPSGLGKMQQELTAISWRRPSVPATDTGPCLHPSEPQCPTDKQQPFLTVAKATSPLQTLGRWLYKWVVPLRGWCLHHQKAPCNEEPQGWEGSERGTAQKHVTAFPSSSCPRDSGPANHSLFSRQPHCQPQPPGRRSDPE